MNERPSSPGSARRGSSGAGSTGRGSTGPDPIGIVAVQGDFAAHAAMLRRLGETPRLVRTRTELDGVAGLILPGGESTTMLRFLDEDALTDPLLEFGRRGRPIFGTCAGLILLAREVRHPEQPCLGLLDVEVERNGYGRQIDSFIEAVEVPSLAPELVEGVFIRAPTITGLGEGVEVLGRCRDLPVLVRQESILACSFHPELSRDACIHRLFIDLVRTGAPTGQGA